LFTGAISFKPIMSTISEESSTYEATKARQTIQGQPDKIHWDRSAAFREQPYRQLHHQRGLIGVFRVRLLEASDLKRSYWSALALGPVKHLGLSKAHGAVSSFCTFNLEYADVYKDSTPIPSSWDKKPAAKKDPPKKQPTVVSPVAPSDNNPVWENCQFEFPLKKGAMPNDGMRINLRVRVDEDATPLEHALPGIPSGGDSRLLGVGSLDLTELCLGEKASGQALPGVMDAWVPVSMAGQEIPELDEGLAYNKDDPLAPPPKKEIEVPPVTGLVRVLVSYQPAGLDPQPKDIVALEAFARRSPSASSCRPLLPPLMPLTVLERRGAYLLASYTAYDNRRACVRLHRNAVFVIERQNLVDAGINLALLPADVWMSTPVGQALGDVAGPVVAAGKEVLMPALLSFKLAWMAVRTTTLAGWSGVQALGSTMWQEGSSSLTASHQPDLYREDRRRDSRAATAQFVQL